MEKDSTKGMEKDVQNPAAGNSGGTKDEAVKDGAQNSAVATSTALSYDQMNQVIAREKENGRNAAYKELGLDPNDKKSVDMIKALIASQKTDEQKAAEKKLEDVAKAREAEERIVKAEIKAEAMVLGLKREYVDDMVALVMSKMADDSDVKTLLSEYKKKYAAWFDGGTKDDDKAAGSVGKRGTGSSIKGDNGGSKEGKDDNKGMGQRLAARRKASIPKKSFWG